MSNDTPGSSLQDQIAQLQQSLGSASDGEKSPESAAPAEPAQDTPSTPEPELTAADAAPEPTTETAAESVSEPAVADASGSLSLFGGDAMGALGSVLDVDSQSTWQPKFPTIEQQGGSSNGGGVEPMRGTPAEIRDIMPSGKRPFYGVFLGYRISASGWPVKYEQDGGEGDARARPCWNVAIPASDAENATLLTAACKAYQYTKRDLKDSFDWDDGAGAGHPRPNFEQLVYLPDIDGCVIIRSPSHYTSLTGSIEELQGRSSGGALKPFAARFVPHSTDPKHINGYDVQHHWIKYHVDQHDEKLAKAWTDFQNWYKTIVADPAGEVQTNYKEWIACQDCPMTDEIRGALVKAKNLGR